MTSFRRYFVYRLGRALPRTIAFTVVSVLFTWLTVTESISRIYVETDETGIYMLAIILGAACTLIPIFELYEFKSRRNLDTLYFFPIKREKLALAHFLCGSVQVLVIYTVSFLSAWIHLALQTNYFKLVYMIPYYFLSLLLGAVMYSVFSFLFLQGNTITDGLLICGLWVFVLQIVVWVIRTELIYTFFKDTVLWTETSNIPSWFGIYTPINNLTVIFQDLIEVNRHSLPYYYKDSRAATYLSQGYMFFIWGAAGIASAVGYFLTFVKKGAEMAGERSDSIFGYKLLIPLYGYSLLAFYSDEPIMAVLIFALMAVAFVIYRRGFKFKPCDLVVMVCGIIAMLFGSINR